MEKKYIDVDKALEELNKTPAYFESGDIRYGIEIAIDTINKLPTADVVEVKHGKWKIKIDEYDCEYMKCSVCKEIFYPVDEDTVDTTPNYCPNCGAKMQ